MEKFATLVIRFRVPILVAATIITIGFAFALPSLTPDDDVMQFLPADDPDVKLFRRVNERFGGLDVAIIGLETDDLFVETRLEEVRALTRRVAEIDGVFDVMSVTEVPDPRPSPFGLVVEPLIDRVPSDQDELDALKKKVLANNNAVGNLISEDGRAAMILCFLGGDREPLHVAREIKKEALASWTGGKIYFGGAPFIRLHVAGGTKEDLVKLTPLVAAVVVLITFLIFRKPLGVLLSLGVVGVAIVWLMGMLAMRKQGLTIVGSSLPTLLLAIGGAYGIHLLAAYFSGKSATVRERIIEAFQEVGAPIIASTLTTCAGFLSFLAMDVGPLRDFGADAAIGVGLTGLLAMTVIPAVLSFGRSVPRALGATLLAAPLGRMGGWAVEHRIQTLVVAVVLAIVGLVGVLRIAPDATLKTFFANNSEPDQANRFLERHFGGSVYVQVYFEGDMRSPFVLAELRKLVEYVNGMEEVVQVSSIIDPLVMMSEAMGGRADLPINRERTQSLYPFLEGSAAINQIVSAEKDASLVQIRLKDISPLAVNQAVAKLSDFIKREIPTGVKAVSLAGLDEGERKRRKQQMQRAVARRIVRLGQMFGKVRFSEQAVNRVAGVLRESNGELSLSPGEDLEEKIRAVVEEHVVGETAPFEMPEEDVSPEVNREWENRGELVFQALLPNGGRKLTEGEVKDLLVSGLPLLSERDPEGLSLSAEAIYNGLASARASVRAERMSGAVFRAAALEDPPEKMRKMVVAAMSDLDAPLFGFPDHSADAKRVMASVTGQPVINVALCESTIRNQLKSLAVAFVVLTLLLSFTFRSIGSAVKALVPAAFMLCMAVGVMGAVPIPLDLTTSMIAAIALGIGVDYAIHFLWRRRRRGESLAETTAHVGPSIASNALQVACGFAVLALSDMVPMQRFGLLVAMTMLLTAMATFVLLPALRAEGRMPLSVGESDETDDAETVPSSAP